jgi:dTDP-4-dehydrorhamnose 3,5-epimerase
VGAIGVDQIVVTPLNRIPVMGGDVLHGIKRNDSGYVDFGEAYFSFIDHGAVKGWKRHLRMTLNFVVPVGSVQFVFIDQASNVRKELAGPGRYVRLTIPPGIWFGFKGLAAPNSLLMNVADIPHDPGEIERKELNGFVFDWDI